MQMLLALLLAAAPAAMQVDLSVRPVTHDTFQLLKRAMPGMYRCSVHIRASEDSPMWGPKDIVISPGEKSDETASLGGMQVRFSAKIGKKGDRAETSVIVLRDNVVIHKQTSTVWLEAPSSSALPLE